MTALGLRTSGRLRLSSVRRPLASPFLPNRLPGLAFWYDAAVSAFADGTWRDLSGNGNDAAQATPSQRPIRTTDEVGRAVLRFDGVNDALLVGTPPDLSGGLTLFAIYRVRTPVDFRGMVTASAATGTDHEQFFTLQYEQAANQRIQVFGRSIQPNQVVTQGADATEKQYAISTFEADGVTIELRDLNGIVSDTSTPAPFGTPAVMVLGARYNQGRSFASARSISTRSACSPAPSAPPSATSWKPMCSNATSWSGTHGSSATTSPGSTTSTPAILPSAAAWSISGTT